MGWTCSHKPMTSQPPMKDNPTPAPGPLSNVDEVVVAAFRTWQTSHVEDRLERFPLARRASLSWGLRAAGGDERPLDRLRREHEAQARPDLSRVHISWWFRALRDEPESVRRAVVAGLPAALADPLAVEFQLSSHDLIPDRTPDPGAVRHALALWSAQLVGDLAERDADPPVIVALTRLDAPSLARLIQTTGLAKWAVADRPLDSIEDRDRERIIHFREALANTDPRFARAAARDLDDLGDDGPRLASQAGLTTFARLLNAAEPYRMRWALQHLPYSTARSLRLRMGPGTRKTPMLSRWESDLLRVAWEGLHQEGRLSCPWGVVT